MPLYDNRGERFPDEYHASLSSELSERFGGVTAYSRSPAVGLWKSDPAAPARRDDIVVYEVFVEDLDRRWWSTYRGRLEERFRQDELVIRAHPIERL